MKRYRLLKDLPTFKAGDLFYISEYGALVYDGGDGDVTAYARQTLDMFPNILTEWFEEIQEPTDSIHWKPKFGDKCWFLSRAGSVACGYWSGGERDVYRWRAGKIYRTEEECTRARYRELAEVRLRRTSTFKPDFENDNGGWVVFYNPRKNIFETQEVYRFDYGEIVRYETEEEAQRSIEKNEEDWLIYFRVYPSNTDKG